MNAQSKATYAEEREAVTRHRPALPPHAGETRYQKALDGDIWFRGSVAAALLVAMLAGSGFGKLALGSGAPRAAVYFAITVWFGWRLLAKRPEKSANAALPNRARILLGIALTGAVAFGIWIAMGDAGVTDLWTKAFCAALGCGVTIVFDSWIRLRPNFSPVVILVVLTHMCTAVYDGGALFLPAEPQFACVLIEFALLGIAGYRYLVALQSRRPVATYRSSPQCIVPRLDRAWDHPVKIDAA